MGDFIPKSDSGVFDFAKNYSGLITLTPVVYGLTSAIATTLAGKYSDYAEKLEAAKSAPTRGGSTVNAKDISKRDLIAFIRQTAKTVQGTPTVTDQQKFDLGINVRKNPSPINPPTVAPVVEVASVVSRTVSLRMHGAGTDRRGKPDGVAGASIFTHTGPTPPAALADWDFQGSTTRTHFDVQFGPDVAAGSQIWICALWYSPRAQNGPACDPISTYIAGGVATAGA